MILVHAGKQSHRRGTECRHCHVGKAAAAERREPSRAPTPLRESRTMSDASTGPNEPQRGMDDSGETIPRPRDDYILAYADAFTLDPASTAVIVVDVQYATASWEAGLGRLHREAGTPGRVEWRLDRVERQVVPRIRRLVDYCRARGIRVVYVTSGSKIGDYSDVAPHFRGLARAVGNREGTREHQIREEIAPLAGEPVFNKTSVSAFTSSGLESCLRALDVRHLLFAGVSTDMCVGLTAADAVERGFRAILVEDCCAAAKPEYHDSALITFQRLFGRVARLDAVLAELDSGAPRTAGPPASGAAPWSAEVAAGT